MAARAVVGGGRAADGGSSESTSSMAASSVSTHNAWRSSGATAKLRSTRCGSASRARWISSSSSGAVIPMRTFITPSAGTGKHCTSTRSGPAVVTSSGSRRANTTFS